MANRFRRSSSSHHRSRDDGASFGRKSIDSTMSGRRASARGSTAGSAAGMRVVESSMVGLTVGFDTIHIREYERLISDNPSCTSGVPIGIGWAFNPKEKVIGVDEYEARRGRRRINNELMMPRAVREKILMKEWGFARHEIAAAVRANVKQKNQRRRTVVNLGRATKIEEMAESAGRKLKRRLLGLKKDSEQYEIWKREVTKASHLMAEETAYAINKGERAAAAAELDSCSSVSNGDLDRVSSAGTYETTTSEPRVHRDSGRFYTLWEREAARASSEDALENNPSEVASEIASELASEIASEVASDDMAGLSISGRGSGAPSVSSSSGWDDDNVIQAECSAVLVDDYDVPEEAAMPVATQVSVAPQPLPDDFSALIHDQVICAVHNTSIEEQKRIIKEFAAAQAAMSPKKSAMSRKSQMDQKYIIDQSATQINKKYIIEQNAATQMDQKYIFEQTEPPQMDQKYVIERNSVPQKSLPPPARPPPRKERIKKVDSSSTASQQKAVRRRTIEEMEGEYWN